MNRARFPKDKTPEFTKMGEIHELFVLALSLVWFAGGTPDFQMSLSEKSDLGTPLIYGPASIQSRLGLSEKNPLQNSGKTPETLSERFLEFPFQSTAGMPQML